MGSTWVRGFWFGWFYVVGCLGARSKKGEFWRYKIFAQACDLGNVGMIVWVIVLH